MLTTSNSSPTSPPLEVTIPLKYPLHAIIDIEDFPAISKYHWSLRKSHSCFYAIRKETVRGSRRTVFMHRQIVGATPDQEVHHKNRNTLDNRRANLEVTTPRLHRLTHAELRLIPGIFCTSAGCLRTPP